MGEVIEPRKEWAVLNSINLKFLIVFGEVAHQHLSALIQHMLRDRAVNLLELLSSEQELENSDIYRNC